MPFRATQGRSIAILQLLAALAWSGGAPVLAGEPNGIGDAGLPGYPGTGCERCVPGPAPHEWDAPYFDLDWSLALRGAYVRDAGGERFEALVVPGVTLRHETMRGGYDLSLSGELARSSLDQTRISALRAAAAADYQFDAVTAFSGNLDLSLTQDSPSAPGLAGNTAIAPLVGTAETQAEVTRELGFFEVGLRGSASRTVYGPTTRTDGSVVDNSEQNNWKAGAGLRLGYAVTPILTAFVDGSAGYHFYDLPSPAYLEKLDAADYAVRAGLNAQWTSVLEAEASIGLGLRQFASPIFPEVVSTLYDARLTFRPDETVTLGGTLSTSIGEPGPNSGGLARVEYAAAADASYQLNTWVRFRAAAGWRQALLVGTANTETGYNAGIGLDYLLNEFATLTADYAYGWSRATPNPAEERHQVTLGVTFSRPGD